MTEFEPLLLLPLLGLGAGAVLGFVARWNHFCTLSSLERLWYAGDSSGVRTWALASLTALIATQLLVAADLASLEESFYLNSRFGWTGAIFGGVMFGIGMALVGTCGFGAVVRLGGGSLRAFVVLIVIGLTALATQRGLIGQARVHVVDNLAVDLRFAGDQSIGSLLSYVLGFDVRRPLVILVGAAGLLWVFSQKSYRRQGPQILTGLLIGLAIAFGWWATSHVAKTAFHPVQIESGSFVVPVGDTIMQFITYTNSLPDYGVGLICGTLVGAVLAALWRRDIRWEACDDARELSRHILGAALMGVGGVIAMGCTVGQGISAFSTMAISAPIVLLSIAFGARLGLAWLFEGSFLAAFQRNHSGHDDRSRQAAE
ncbi:YeeE/YedE family protein [Roseibium aggregatum]|uniref:YeeE/YedE family protein n=1 Tax=Roseibium aggregatum TaxID=187304 RepID=A0A926NR83_9HYPH|nr:YeeE/YedE family protein [Roseibium aggregatum]MBD1544984.1 YeeE/YedE family protein [Roseibium aggregatum]